MIPDAHPATGRQETVVCAAFGDGCSFLVSRTVGRERKRNTTAEIGSCPQCGRAVVATNWGFDHHTPGARS